jgi:hypothetical protein
VRNRRLRQRLVGSDDWIEFASTSSAQTLLDGIVSVDENHFPGQGFSGCTLRTLDLAKRRWSIYWINSTQGGLFPPVHGGFDGDRGEFYGTDEDDGHFVLVRFVWLRQAPGIAHWEQSFSQDGREWETNWVMELRREG